jgi:hypothetical protein
MKDIRIFGEHVSIESKNKVQLNELSFDSSHAKRCKKAVRENMSKSFQSRGHFQVLKLYKLEHSILSNHLHNAASVVENGVSSSSLSLLLLLLLLLLLPLLSLLSLYH